MPTTLTYVYDCGGQTDEVEFINILHIAIKCYMHAHEIFISIDLCDFF